MTAASASVQVGEAAPGRPNAVAVVEEGLMPGAKHVAGTEFAEAARVFLAGGTR